MSTILLFYKYITLEKPEDIRDWQRTLCLKLGLKGRIILASEGINGTVGGSQEAIEQYKKALTANPLFADIDFKEAPGGAECFPKLRVIVKKEIVNFGIDTQKVSAKDAGIYLTPTQAHELINQKPADLMLFDARNNFESRVGTFKDAITPNINHFRDLPSYIDTNLEQFKDKDVLMFCTGGVRCERATAYLKLKNVAKKVYHLQGGIHRYIEQYPDGHFRGKNYVFDGRVTVAVNEDVLSSCDICSQPCDEFANCLNASCNKLFLACPSCLPTFAKTCSKTCMELLHNKQVQERPAFKKFDQKSVEK